MKGEPILGKRPASLSVRSTIRLNPKLVSGGNMMFNVEIRFESTRRIRNDVANAAVRHGGENESRILGTVSTESASVSVA